MRSERLPAIRRFATAGAVVALALTAWAGSASADLDAAKR